MSKNGQIASIDHPFKGISQAPRTFVYVIGTLTVSVAFMVFTESYLRFINGLWWQTVLVLTSYSVIVANLNFYIVRRLARKLFEGHIWVYIFPIIFSVPWTVWSYFKEELFGWEWIVILVVFAISGIIGTYLAIKKAAIFREEFLEKWHTELKRQHEAGGGEMQ